MLRDPDGESAPANPTLRLEETSLSERQFPGLLGERARAQQLGEQDQSGGAAELAGSLWKLHKRVQRGTGRGQELHGDVLPRALSVNLGCLLSYTGLVLANQVYKGWRCQQLGPWCLSQNNT